MLQSVEIVFTFLNQGWVGTIVGLASLFAAIVIFYMSRQKSVPICQERSLSLIGQKDKLLPSDIEIFFKHKLINRLYPLHLKVRTRVNAKFESYR